MGGGDRRSGMAARHRSALAALLVLLAIVPAFAQQPGPVDGLLERLQIKPTLAPAPDFVERSRSAKPQAFQPVHQTHPDRATKVMTPAEVAAAEADLDATRERVQRRGGVKPASVPLKPAKAPTPPAPKFQKTLAPVR